MPQTSLRRRLVFILIAIGLLCGGLFNFIKPGDYSRLAHLQALAAGRMGAGPLISDAEMILIAPGRFIMGSPANETGRGRDEDQHPVRLSAFLLDKYPVTQEQWQAVTGGNPSFFKGSGRLPVEGVSWYDCIEFCNRLSQREGRTPCYHHGALGTDLESWPKDWKQHVHDDITCDWSADGYRLPTEAEWEFACRAGTTGATPFGSGLCASQANFNGQHPYRNGRKGPNRQRTTEVEAFPPNAWGLYDLSGNSSEWCWDWYGPYPKDEQLDPHGAPASGSRVYRGGSWFSYGVDLRSAVRFSDSPCSHPDTVSGGLRLARRVSDGK
jgi:formylglycine-generating enzyme required for sulfatase activity